MKILVLNGSPKAGYSITIHTSYYIEKCTEGHQWNYLNIQQRINKWKKDASELIDAIEESDLVIFSYPVYTLLAPYCVHQTIELMKEKGIRLDGKWATQITTSKHFYDTTAHRFIEENLLDLGAYFIDGLSADMDDLLSPIGQKEALTFFETVVFQMENNIYKRSGERWSEASIRAYESHLPVLEKDIKKKVSIVTNAAPDDEALLAMISDFRNQLRAESTVYNIREYPFKSGCIGCFSCADSGVCMIKDGFDDYLRNEIQNADSLVYAFRIKNHFTDSSLKCFDDRQFCNGHRQVTSGKPTLYLIAGDYSKEENLRTVVEARSSVGGNYLSYVITDEHETDVEIEKGAKALSYALQNDIVRSRNFYGVGGNKIFRDLIYKMRGMMKADYRFYKRNGYLDFPQKDRKTILMMKMVGLMMKMPDRKHKMKKYMNDGMIYPYRKVIDNIEGK